MYGSVLVRQGVRLPEPPCWLFPDVYTSTSTGMKGERPGLAAKLGLLELPVRLQRVAEAAHKGPATSTILGGDDQAHLFFYPSEPSHQ